ncbi:hypothetical protein GmHk_17G048076 [Glycine max]|nr:hypothetical protein GmHk_17G048076 [Glycine max]
MHKATLTVPQNRTRVPLSKFTNRNNVVLLFLQLQMENRTRLKVQKKRPIKRSGREVLLKKVLDYLKSDTYMYAPLLSSPTSDFPSPNAFPSSAKEPLQDCGMIRMDGSDRMLRMKVNQRAGHLGNANQSSESHLPQTDLSDQHTRGHTETVKHTVYQRCRSTSATSKRFAS